jgi:hypothetical protein
VFILTPTQVLAIIEAHMELPPNSAIKEDFPLMSSKNPERLRRQRKALRDKERKANPPPVAETDFTQVIAELKEEQRTLHESRFATNFVVWTLAVVFYAIVMLVMIYNPGIWLGNQSWAWKIGKYFLPMMTWPYLLNLLFSRVWVVRAWGLSVLASCIWWFGCLFLQFGEKAVVMYNEASPPQTVTACIDSIRRTYSFDFMSTRQRNRPTPGIPYTTFRLSPQNSSISPLTSADTRGHVDESYTGEVEIALSQSALGTSIRELISHHGMTDLCRPPDQAR